MSIEHFSTVDYMDKREHVMRHTDDIESSRAVKGEEGFSLIEAVCALVIILIALLGVAFAFTYSITYNAGNHSRSQALTVLQEEVEKLRAAKFTPTQTDPMLTGGVKTPRIVPSPSGAQFRIEVSVDNDPFTAGVQTDAGVPDATLKEITVTATLTSPSPGWQTAVPATIILRRVRAN